MPGGGDDGLSQVTTVQAVGGGQMLVKQVDTGRAGRVCCWMRRGEGKEWRTTPRGWPESREVGAAICTELGHAGRRLCLHRVPLLTVRNRVERRQSE